MRPRLAFARVLQSPSRQVAAFLALGMALAACKSSSSPSVSIGSVTVSPGTATRVAGETVQLTATAKTASGTDVQGRTFNWSSSATAVASVDANGLVTAHAVGTTTITAETGGVEGTATITVAPPVASITVTPEQDTLGVGKSLAPTVVLLDENGAPVTGREIAWTSSIGSVASVSPAGLITAVGEGVTQITGTIDGQSDAISITVFEACDTRLSTPIAIGETLQGQLETTDCPFGDGTFLDGFRIAIGTTVDVEITMMSGAFDAYLFLLKEDGDSLLLVDEDDDGAGGTNARITATLDGGGVYHIVANSFDPNSTGPYSVSILDASLVAGSREAGESTRPGKGPTKRSQSVPIPLRLPPPQR